jgi:hypothetical protein
MKVRITLLLVILLASWAGSSAAQEPAATPIPAAVKPNFDSMRYLLGRWSCAVVVSGRAAPHLVSYVYTLDPGGFWLIGAYRASPTNWFPYANSGEERVTYDEYTARWIRMYADAFGEYAAQTSPGWQGNTITWRSLTFAPSKGYRSISPTTERKVSPASFVSALSLTTRAGAIQRVTKTCTKQR